VLGLKARSTFAGTHEAFKGAEEIANLMKRSRDAIRKNVIRLRQTTLWHSDAGSGVVHHIMSGRRDAVHWTRDKAANFATMYRH
jgi:hypothetical protein